MNAEHNTQLPSTSFLFQEMDGEALAQLHQVLAQVEEGRGTLVRLADLMGGAVGRATQLGLQGLALAPGLQAKLQRITEVAIEQSFRVAILGMGREGPATQNKLRENMMQAAVAISGAAGGFGGFASMAPDVGFTTLAIMREIASIARENGEDLRDEETRRACLEVFALRSVAAGRREDGEESDLGFFAARGLMRGQPLVMLMAEVAGHYGIALSRKLAAQMIPVAGALCGAALNSAFLAHYRAVARAHFTIRRLERTHGTAVKEAAQAYRGRASESDV
ncbi:EcsC family protein [Saccharibacter sp. 17.LH.SD]|uniref:EcsC family protein n=1 Tax=Saccharibacter sp. 17.LH.SD TaxID=2689393 RepID=UPI00136CB07F|nr:EcsC family protein [Saccharibacter sp. 17.LH.SD]MXV43956.1 EcsC family protein [Saccharibacter sp. 17.LH.SD]